MSSEIMKVKEIEYLVPPRDLVNNCFDVFVTLENASDYVLEVTTPAFLVVLREKSNCVSARYQYIIVLESAYDIVQIPIQ